MNNLILKHTNLLLALGLLLGTATVSAADNDIWRYQVSNNSSQSVVSFTVGKEGSSFIDQVRNNHLPVAQDHSPGVDQPRRLLSDVDNAGNWFFNTISPKTYNYGS